MKEERKRREGGKEGEESEGCTSVLV